MHDEVKAVSSSQRLSVLVAQQIGTALGMLASKAQYMAATGPDARALGSGTTAAQQRNIALANALQEVHRSMLQLQQKLPAQAHAHMRYGEGEGAQRACKTRGTVRRRKTKKHTGLFRNIPVYSETYWSI